jgi:hypothetical protein
LESHDLWILTNTYGASKVSVNAWQGRQRKTAFFTGASDSANVNAWEDFYVSPDEGWINHDAKVRMSSMAERRGEVGKVSADAHH